MEYTETRIAKLRTYLFGILDAMVYDSKYQINANMLSLDVNNYSLDKIPTETEVEHWIIGDEIHRDLFSFRSRVAYSQDTINNLKNVGFFEEFERIIRQNNKEGNLPDIEGIQSIECLNCGAMAIANTNTAEFDIQLQITYIANDDTGGISL